MNEERFNAELSAISGGEARVRTPQFMGMQKGKNIEEVRALIKKQKRVKGFEFSIGTGTTSFDLQLSGTARLMLGFALVNPNVGSITGTPDNMTFTVNNEVVIDKVKPFFFTNYLMDDEYYFIPRPLSGTDQLKMDFQNSGAAQTWWRLFTHNH